MRRWWLAKSVSHFDALMVQRVEQTFLTASSLLYSSPCLRASVVNLCSSNSSERQPAVLGFLEDAFGILGGVFGGVPRGPKLRWGPHLLEAALRPACQPPFSPAEYSPTAPSRELSLLHELGISDVRVVWYAAQQSFGEIPSPAELGTERNSSSVMLFA